MFALEHAHQQKPGICSVLLLGYLNTLSASKKLDSRCWWPETSTRIIRCLLVQERKFRDASATCCSPRPTCGSVAMRKRRHTKLSGRYFAGWAWDGDDVTGNGDTCERDETKVLEPCTVLRRVVGMSYLEDIRASRYSAWTCKRSSKQW